MPTRTFAELLADLSEDIELRPAELDQRQENGSTLLHYASNGDVAAAILASYENDKREEFIWRQSTDHGTALNAAVANQRIDAVDYLVNCVTDERPTEKSLYFTTNPLHHAKTKDMAILLLDKFVDETIRAQFLKQVDAQRCTALHKASKGGYEEIVEFLCLEMKKLSLENLMVCADQEGNTALHVACTANIAVQLCDHVPKEKLPQYVCQKNNSSRTALHTAVVGDHEEIVTVLCKYVREVCSSPVETQLLGLFDSMVSNEPNQLAGHFILWLICEGKVEEFEDLLGYIDEYYKGTLGNALCQVTNQWGQNAFHLSSLSPKADDLFDVLRTYLGENIKNIEDVLTTDEWNNTPLTYLVGRFHKMLASEFILRIPWCDRERHVRLKNAHGMSCLDIARQNFDATDPPRLVWQTFSPEIAKQLEITEDGVMRYNVLAGASGEETPKGYLDCNSDVLYAMKYALNEYPQTDLNVDTELQEKQITSGTLKWFLFDVDDYIASAIQKELYKLDTPDNHGKPKVVVVRFAPGQEVTYISLPGPDFAILTVVSPITGSDILDRFSSAQFTRLKDLVDEVKFLDGVEYVNVNSTLEKHFQRPKEEIPDDAIILNSDNKGMALIICFKKSRDHYEIELKRTERVFACLGLQVKKEDVVWGGSKDEVIKAVEDFSGLPMHRELAAVAVMTHGDRNGDMCDDSGGTFSVNDILGAMSSLKSYALVFLTFCRGNVPQCECNRTREAYECTTLPQNAAVMPFKVEGRTIRPEKLNQLRNERVAYPSVAVDENRLLVYPTLPDSLLTRCSDEEREEHHSVNKMSACLERCMQQVEMTHQLNQTNSERPPAIELTTLFTDVAGLVREKSAFTQYMNVCYTVNKRSRPVYVALAPSIDVQT